MNTKTFIMGGALLLFGCGGGAQIAVNRPDSTKPNAPTVDLKGEAKEKYDRALDAFNAHDKANDWNEATCNEVAGMFDAAVSAAGGKLAPATYNAAKTYQRCSMDDKAKAKFEILFKDDPKNHFARAELALYKYKQDSNEDAAISELQQVVLDAQFQNVPALVDLAAIQLLRDGPSSSSNDCKDDFDCAKRNLQRALAIDDAYMPAFNQLALYYFSLAKKRAGSVKLSAKGARGRSIMTNAAMGKRADVQQLELAALVVSQAVRKNAGYAPIHNTAGLIQNELGQINGAVQSFKTAAKLDPKFFEAQMNYAAVNLSFRGFEEAAGAYKRALEMRPNDYDAHLGLALALRGLITDSNYDQQVTAVQSELETCKKVGPDRPDAYYNEGILTQEYKAKSGGDKTKTIASLTAAKGIFQQFVEKAGGKNEYDGAVKRAKERMQDIDDTITFLNLGDQGPKDEPKADDKKPGDKK